MAVRITYGTHAERHAVDHQGSVPPADLTGQNAFEECPDGYAAHLGVGLEADTGRDLLLIEELEPLFADEFAVSQETRDPLGR
jgi:hypothetical protein